MSLHLSLASTQIQSSAIGRSCATNLDRAQAIGFRQVLLEENLASCRQQSWSTPQKAHGPPSPPVAHGCAQLSPHRSGSWSFSLSSRVSLLPPVVRAAAGELLAPSCCEASCELRHARGGSAALPPGGSEACTLLGGKSGRPHRAVQI